MRFFTTFVRYRWAFAILLAAGAFLLIFYYQLQSIREDVEYAIARMKMTYGVSVKYEQNREAFFPREYLTNPVYAKASNVSVRRLREILPTIERFLSAYPSEVTKRHLRDIFVVGTLELEGVPVAGAYIDRAIYLGTKWAFLHYVESWQLLATMHAELSSILFHHNAFPREEWENINPPGWKYEIRESQMLRRKDLYVQTENRFRDGFLERYSQSSLENDFNTLVEWAVARPVELQELSARYERISQKYDLMKQFYRSLDPTIDVSKFSERSRGTSS